MKKLLILGVISFLFLHCNKEKMGEVCIPLSEQAAKFPPVGPTYGPLILFGGNSSWGFRYVDFNPNNADEILIRGLTRYNLKTGDRVVLPKGDLLMTSRPRWSKKDWIIFAAQSGPQSWDAYKIKSNGDSLTRLTYMGNCHYPEWNLDGNKFICYLGLTTPTISIVFDEYGNILDTVSGGGDMRSWRHDSLYAITGYGSLFIKDPVMDSIVLKTSFDDHRTSFNGGCEWIDGEQVVWSYENGIFKTNVATGQTIQLKASCDAITYDSPTYSRISGQLFFIRRDYKHTSFDSGTVKSSIVMIDPDDGAEEEVEIEEW